MRLILIISFLVFTSQHFVETLKIYKAPYVVYKNNLWIFLPAYEEKNKTILFLHGWNLSPFHFIYLPSVENFVVRNDYKFIIPEMGKSLYSTNFFPESKEWIKKYPNLQYCIEVAYKYRPNILIGISTGARGAALLNIYTGDSLFDKILLFSGDYDQTKMPKDKLITAVYGSFYNFPERWQFVDNPYYLVRTWETTTFIAHAKDDKIVPFEQSLLFYKKLSGMCDSIYSYFPWKGGHTSEFWEESFNLAVKNIF